MALTLLRGRVFTPLEEIEDGAVLIDGARIAAVGTARELGTPAGASVRFAKVIAPGFIDLQINGAFGRDFALEPRSVHEVAARLPSTGVTAFLPTLVSLPRQAYPPLLRAFAEAPPPAPLAALPLGVHLEGPFLSPRRAGAHEASSLALPRAGDAGWILASGLVRLVTLAPELPGALSLARELAAAGVLVAAGHTDATYEETRAALGAGVRLATHLFNAMPPLHHRQPGAAGALLESPECAVALIADGVHLHPAVVALAHRLKPGLVALVTDAIAAAGLPPGASTLAGQRLLIDGSSARLADGTLAGSVSTMDQVVRNYRSFTNCSIGCALAAASLVPARLLGIDHQRGRIAPGLCADLVLLDEELRVESTLVAGVQRA